MTSIQIPVAQFREALSRGHAHGISVIERQTIVNLGGVIPDTAAIVVFGDMPGTYAVRLEGLDDATGHVTAMPVRSERTISWVGAHL
jgi:hypothetical protein